MSVHLEGGTIVMSGACGVEEAETLVHLIEGNPYATVDVSRAGPVHTALWQVLLALTPPLSGEPADAFLRDWIMPALLPRDGTAT